MDCRVLAVCVLALVCGSMAALPALIHVHQKFEFKYSFKGPYLINKQGKVPFWNYGGSCIPSDDQVRVCPSIKSRRGWLWTKEKFSASHWMVDMVLRVSGRLKTGADGLAIWYTAEPGSEGMALGNTDVWSGLGIMLDSFDNNGLHDNPKIQVVVNDGAHQFDHGGDGINQELGSCLKDFRNKPNPIKLRIIYLRGVLEVWVHEGVSSVADDYVLCARVDHPKHIPQAGHFGLSAATGGLSDDHDVLSFIVHSLRSLEEKEEEEFRKAFDEAEMEKVTGKYSSMAEEFDERREQYEKEHPSDEGDWQYEMEMEGNVRYIADKQAQLSRDISTLHQKLDALLAGGGGGGGGGDVVKRNLDGSVLPDIIAIKNTEANILHQLADLRTSLEKGGPQGSKVATSEQLQPVYEVKGLVQESNQRLVAMETYLKQQQGSGGHKCPPVTAPPSCLSPSFFLVVIAMQLLALLGYGLYRQRQAASAKKFF